MTAAEALHTADHVKRHRMEFYKTTAMGHDSRRSWKCSRCGFLITEITQGTKVHPVPEPTPVCWGKP